MNIFTTFGDVFGLGSDVAGALQSPQDQTLLTQIPQWKQRALTGDAVAYNNLQCVAGNTQYGSCPASGYVQGVARSAVQEVDATTTIAHGAGQGAGILTGLGNYLAPNSFWQGYANTFGTTVGNIQLVALLAVGLILYLVLRRER